MLSLGLSSVHLGSARVCTWLFMLSHNWILVNPVAIKIPQIWPIYTKLKT